MNLKDMIMRFFLAVQPMRKITSKENAHGAQPRENDHKRETDLPE